MVGRDAIRTGTSAYQQVPAYQGTVNFEQSAYVLHETADPNVFIADDRHRFDKANGQRTTMLLVKIFRVRDGQIVSPSRRFHAPAVRGAPTAPQTNAFNAGG